MRRWIPLTLICLAVSACKMESPTDAQAGPTGSADTSADQVTQPTDSASATPGAPKPDVLKVSVPQLAYDYKLEYRLPADAVAKMQDRHVAMCRQLGPARCQLFAMDRSESKEGYPQASLKLRVATDIAHDFQQSLGQSITSAGGEASNTNINAEDVSKDAVDTQARIHQRELLVARLTEVLRTRKGSVSDLVAAERDVAQAQQELDEAKAWLAQLQTRVALSNFDISYIAATPAGADRGMFAELGDSVAASGSAFGIGIRGLLTLAILIAPWMLLVVPGVLIIRALRKRQARIDAAQAQG